MSWENDFEADLIRDEADRPQVYDDATGLVLKPGMTLVGNPTVGTGRNLLDPGLSSEERRYLRQNDMARVFAELDHMLPWWRACPPAVRRGLSNLCFNMGITKLMARNPKTLAYLRAGTYNSAADELLLGPYKDQVGLRATRISNLFRSAGGQTNAVSA